jgi:hypothetical protein
MLMDSNNCKQMRWQKFEVLDLESF